MEILVEARYLEHGGGTKFYEAIEFYNVAVKKFVLVKRWGNVGLKHGGGGTKIETYNDIRQCQDAAGKILREKRTRDARGLSYDIVRETFGLHGAKSSIDAETLRSALGSHYNNIDITDKIISALDVVKFVALPSGYALVDDVVDDVANFVVSEGPAPELERSDDWGSW
jgi:predicted DNA-binding WGR domain protein